MATNQRNRFHEGRDPGVDHSSEEDDNDDDDEGTSDIII